MAKNIRVVKNRENPETQEVLAASLIKIADAFDKLMKEENGLNMKGIVTLLHGMRSNTVGKREIELVLNNLKRLKSYYVRGQ